VSFNDLKEERNKLADRRKEKNEELKVIQGEEKKAAEQERYILSHINAKF